MNNRKIGYIIGGILLVVGLLVFLFGLYTAFVTPLNNVPQGSVGEVLVKNQKFTINSIGVVTMFGGLLVIIVSIILVFLTSKNKIFPEDENKRVSKKKTIQKTGMESVKTEVRNDAAKTYVKTLKTLKPVAKVEKTISMKVSPKQVVTKPVPVKAELKTMQTTQPVAKVEKTISMKVKPIKAVNKTQINNANEKVKTIGKKSN